MIGARDWSGATIGDLWWFFNNNLAHIMAYRAAIAEGGRTVEQTDAYAREIRADVEEQRLIVAELRARGQSVDWEE